MIIYIDGDNSPGTRTEGIGALTSEDALHIYYSSSNSYYMSSKRQKKIHDVSGCAVKFVQVKAASNAVDFAIAIDASVSACQSKNETIVLISEDKHFTTIADYLKIVNNSVNVYVEKSIRNAALKYKMLDLDSLGAFRKYLYELYGADAAESFYALLKTMFKEELDHESRKSHDNKMQSINAIFHFTKATYLFDIIKMFFQRSTANT